MLRIAHIISFQYRDVAMICWESEWHLFRYVCIYNVEMRPLHVGNVRKANGLLCLYTDMRT